MCERISSNLSVRFSKLASRSGRTWAESLSASSYLNIIWWKLARLAAPIISFHGLGWLVSSAFCIIRSSRSSNIVEISTLFLLHRSKIRATRHLSRYSCLCRLYAFSASAKKSFAAFHLPCRYGAVPNGIRELATTISPSSLRPLSARRKYNCAFSKSLMYISTWRTQYSTLSFYNRWVENLTSIGLTCEAEQPRYSCPCLDSSAQIILEKVLSKSSHVQRASYVEVRIVAILILPPRIGFVFDARWLRSEPQKEWIHYWTPTRKCIHVILDCKESLLHHKTFRFHF